MVSDFASYEVHVLPSCDLADHHSCVFSVLDQVVIGVVKLYECLVHDGAGLVPLFGGFAVANDVFSYRDEEEGRL